MSRAAVLAERRRILVERSRRGREELAAALAELSPGLAVADRLTSLACWTGRHRLLVAAVAAAAVAWSRPRRIFGFATRAWALWRSVRALREKLSSVPHQMPS